MLTQGDPVMGNPWKPDQVLTEDAGDDHPILPEAGRKTTISEIVVLIKSALRRS